jgi:hypothetical protein
MWQLNAIWVYSRRDIKTKAGLDAYTGSLEFRAGGSSCQRHRREQSIDSNQQRTLQAIGDELWQTQASVGGGVGGAGVRVSVSGEQSFLSVSRKGSWRA